MTKPVERSEIVDYQTYAELRSEVRESVMKQKEPRRIHVGPHLTFLFENHATMRYQIQEMMRAEQIVREKDVRHEIDTYNELMPADRELSATLFVEITEAAEIRPALDRLIGVDEPGDYELLIGIDGDVVKKTLRATDLIERLSPERPPTTFIDQLEWPSEKPLDRNGPVRSITLGYPDGTIGFLGWDFEWRWAWMVLFFVLTMVVALILRKPMGVEL